MMKLTEALINPAGSTNIFMVRNHLHTEAFINPAGSTNIFMVRNHLHTEALINPAVPTYSWSVTTCTQRR